MRRKCAAWCCLALLLGCAATCGIVRLTGTKDMTIDEAMRVAGNDLTPEQRATVVAAVRRQMLAGARFLRTEQFEPGRAGREASIALQQVLAELSR